MRYKEFNNNKVLEDCMGLFWKNGFNATSITTVVEHTRVNRFSLYHEFDNKHGILDASLGLYRERYANELITALDKKGEVVTVLKDFLHGFIKRKNSPVGCYIIYIATELADNNESVNQILKAYLSDIENKFENVLNTDPKYTQEAKTIANNLVLLFCNVMCYCYIQTEQESEDFIQLNLEVILDL